MTEAEEIPRRDRPPAGIAGGGARSHLLPAALACIVTAIVVVALWFGRQILIPFAIAVIIWYLISALSKLIGRVRIAGRHLHGWPATTVSVLFMLVALAFFAQQVGNSILRIRDAAPTYATNLQALLDEIARLTGITDAPRLGALLQQVDFRAFATDVAGAVANVAGSAGLILVYVLFLLFEQSVFDRKLAALARDEQRYSRLRAIIGRVQRDVQTYLWVKTLTSLLTGIVSYGILEIFGVDYAGFWGFLIFLLNYIPTIGSLIGVMFPAAMTVLQFGTLYPFLAVTLLLTAVQIVIGNFVEPRMMGRSLNISPLVVMLSLVAWGLLWGVTGMVLCVPLTVILMIIFSNFESTRAVAVLLSTDGQVPLPEGDEEMAEAGHPARD